MLPSGDWTSLMYGGERLVGMDEKSLEAFGLGKVKVRVAIMLMARPKSKRVK